MMKKYIVLTGSGPVNREIIALIGENYPDLQIIQVSYSKRTEGIDPSLFIDANNQVFEKLDEATSQGEIVGVVNRYDTHILLAGKISDRYQLPGSSYDALLKFKHKGLFHDWVIKKVGGDVRPITKVSTLDNVVSDVCEFNYPYVVKPAFGVKSRGIFVIRQESDLMRAREYWDKYFAKNKYFYDYEVKEQVLIEEYIDDAKMFTVTCYMDNQGKLKILDYIDVYRGADVGQDHMQLVYRTNESILSREVISKIKDTLIKIVEGSGLRSCFLHPEFLIKGDKVYIVEVNVRIGGFRRDMAYYSRGINLDLLNIKLATQEKIEVIESQKKGVTACEAWIVRRGKIMQITYPDDEGIFGLKKYFRVGDYYEPPPQGDVPICMFYAVGKDSLDRARKYREGIEIVIDED